MPNVDFGPIPPFVHIKSVYMRQFWPQIIRLLPLLRQFSGNFTNSLMLHLNTSIDWYNLRGHSFTGSDIGRSYDVFLEFVSCLRIMLEIFEQCLPLLTFCVNYQQMDILSLIASTLELSSVQESEKVHFLFPAFGGGYRNNNQHSFQNQVKVISDWLHRPYVKGGNNRSEYIRSLAIGSTEIEHRLMLISRSSIEQLIEDLKVVSFLSKFYCLLNLLQKVYFSIIHTHIFKSVGKPRGTLENQKKMLLGGGSENRFIWVQEPF